MSDKTFSVLSFSIHSAVNSVHLGRGRVVVACKPQCAGYTLDQLSQATWAGAQEPALKKQPTNHPELPSVATSENQRASGKAHPIHSRHSANAHGRLLLPKI